MDDLIHMSRHDPKPWVEQAKKEADQHIARLQKLIGLMFHTHQISWEALQHHGATEWEDPEGVPLSAYRRLILEEIAK